MMMVQRFGTFVSALALACAVLPLAADAASLWKVVSVDGQAVPGATIEMTPGKISGNGGCNRYTAPAKFIRGMAEIGPVAATKTVCDTFESEQAFFSALERTRRFSVEGSGMTLLDEDGKPLILLSR
jgi:heat shock protein HslJ